MSMDLKETILEDLKLCSLIDHLANVEGFLLDVINEVQQKAEFILYGVERTLFFRSHAVKTTISFDICSIYGLQKVFLPVKDHFGAATRINRLIQVLLL